MSVHNSLQLVNKWVDIDVTDKEIKDNYKDLLKKDMLLDSPRIKENFEERYKNLRPHLSNLGNTQLDIISGPVSFKTSSKVVLATIKFKKSIRNEYDNIVLESY